MQIVKVKYFKPNFNAYAGMSYAYKTELPLEVGDKVIAPTAKETQQRALVVEVNLPAETISPEWEDKVRFITEYDTEEACVR